MRYDVATRWNSAYLMLARATYLQEVIQDFLRKAEPSRNTKWKDLQLTDFEWQMVRVLVTILYPFFTTSVQLQSTTRPRIGQVFYTYETLFNKLDKLDELLSEGKWKSEKWSLELASALRAMRAKLSKYYGGTTSFVYSDAVILDPALKLRLFQKWAQAGEPAYMEDYSSQCRDRFLRDYHQAAEVSDQERVPTKRKHQVSVDDETWDSMRESLATNDEPEMNEYDQYLAWGSSSRSTALVWWRENHKVCTSVAQSDR
jgi:hypothetical protein